MKKIYIKTYGCQMNVYDSERMYELMKPHGYRISENYEDCKCIYDYYKKEGYSYEECQKLFKGKL